MFDDYLLREFERNRMCFEKIEQIVRDWNRLAPALDNMRLAASSLKGFEDQLRLLHESSFFAPATNLARHLQVPYGSMGSIAELLREHDIASIRLALVSPMQGLDHIADQCRQIVATLNAQKAAWDIKPLLEWGSAGASIADSISQWYRAVPQISDLRRGLDLAHDLADLLERSDFGADSPIGSVSDEDLSGDVGNEIAEHFQKETLEETLAGIKATVEKILATQTTPSKKSTKFLKGILHLVLFLVMHLVSIQIDDRFLGPKPKVDKGVHKEITALSQINENLPQELRVVKATQLHVRAAPTRKGRAIGRLYARDCVMLIERRRSWSRVEYRGHDGKVIITGWVFSRYLLPVYR